MRTFLVSKSPRWQRAIIISLTITLSFAIAMVFRSFFDAHLLAENTELISAVYQTVGMLYAILLTFTLWGVWQNYSEAGNSVQIEADTLIDMVHLSGSVARWKNMNINGIALMYCNTVLEKEWPDLKNMSNEYLNIKEASGCEALNLVHTVQRIIPENDHESVVFAKILNMLSEWLDSRRKRLLNARGNSAKALWPLLIISAFVLFGFHGLFVAKAMGIWLALLLGFSLIIGITFYLIFTLDCPFAGFPSIDSEPFKYARNVLKKNVESSRESRQTTECHNV